jgi:hypothetical protein
VRSYDCLATGVDPFGRAKLLLSRIPVSPLDRPARREPRPPKGEVRGAPWDGVDLCMAQNAFLAHS